MSWKGTAVPNTGVVEKVYFNTNLSVDETKNILVDFLTNNLEADEYGQYTYYFLLSEEWDRMITVSYAQYEDYVGIFAIIDGETKFVYSSKTMTEDDITIEKGWHYFEFEINKEVIPIHEDGSGELGQFNDKLSSLFSITPFEQGEVTLEGLLTDTCEAIREKEGTTDLIPAVDIPARIRALSSGSSGGSEVIEVDELPTENIDKNAIYKVKKKMTDAYIFTSFTDMTVSGIANITGCEIVKNKPTSNIVESNVAATVPDMYLYYVESENDIFVYANIGYGAMWFSTGLLMGQLNSILAGLSFKGELEYLNINQTVTSGTPNYSNVYGYYAVISSEKKYKYNGTTWETISPLNKSEDLLKLVADDLEELTFPKSLNVVPKYFSYHKNKLKKAIIEEGIIRIEEFAFTDCKNLESVEIPSTVGQLEENIFNGCIKLKNVKIPDGIYGIPKYMFAGCDNLNSVVLPNSLEYISSRAFSNCGNLQILYKGTETEWDNVSKSQAFEGTTYNVTYNYVE